MYLIINFKLLGEKIDSKNASKISIMKTILIREKMKRYFFRPQTTLNPVGSNRISKKDD